MFTVKSGVFCSEWSRASDRSSLEIAMRARFASLRLLVVVLLYTPPLFGQAAGEIISIDATAPSHPFPHYWEQMFGSGRAILTLRASWRRDLRDVKQITGFQYVRFHRILPTRSGSAVVLVSPQRCPAERLQQVGRHDHPIHQAPGRSLRHR